ncbi:MAG TPA: hypothetical protein VF484_00855 [Candidatus Limnocylindrales bacterium]
MSDRDLHELLDGAEIVGVNGNAGMRWSPQLLRGARIRRDVPAPLPRRRDREVSR